MEDLAARVQEGQRVLPNSKKEHKTNQKRTAAETSGLTE